MVENTFPFLKFRIAVGVKESVDKPLEIWFSDLRLGTLNPDNGLIEPDFGCIKPLNKSWKVLPMSSDKSITDVIGLYLWNILKKYWQNVIIILKWKYKILFLFNILLGDSLWKRHSFLLVYFYSVLEQYLHNLEIKVLHE